ncbi:hypothetical protein FA13DRAFT_46110 [Coprinellus micaceus]|uniref:Uncharacterized protein n=1 Tax=Coprinellus micaceus TaxID=71717 RepID=A0A4Y7U181_COPMI|nr:hypothetical protein FA13DRAFT_46110 [Coprinellus micaceus]
MFIPTHTSSNVLQTSATESATSPHGLGIFTVSDDIAGVFLMFGLLAFYGVALWDRWKQIRVTKNERLISGRGLSALRPRIAGRVPSYGTMKARGHRPRPGPSKPASSLRKGTPKVRATQPVQKDGSRVSSPIPPIPDSNRLQVPSIAGTPISR